MKYHIGHKDLLKAFLKDVPEITRIIEFGDKKYDWDKMYPEKFMLRSMPTNKRVKLCRFDY